MRARSLGSKEREKSSEFDKRERKGRTHVEVEVAGLVAVLGRDLDGGAGAVKRLLRRRRSIRRGEEKGKTKKKRLESEREG